MFAGLQPPEADPIIRLMTQFAEDARPDRIDLGVGVYRDAAGRTPVMAAVAAAEERILGRQQTKSYLGLAGDPRFLAAMRALLLGDAVPAERLAAVATPGGSGAIRQALELVRLAAPGATVWISRPSWPNHEAIARAVGLRVRSYAYLDPATGDLDSAGMLADLAQAAPGDVVILHGCCHNPCGADLSAADWSALGDLAESRGFLPFVDVAYQGFGDGVQADVADLRLLAARLPELLIAASGSKSFGLYRERVGLVAALCADAGAAGRVGAALAALNRRNYAFPPDHGARVVTTILEDRVLRADWEAELATQRARVVANRTGLAAALAETTGTDRFAFLPRHRGMFSLLGLSPGHVARLRTEHAVYLVGDSRINLAGLTPATIPAVARAVASVLCS
jgi:aromatic-amino-acid transaminase